MTNPLIEQGDLLSFDNLAPSCVTPAVRVLIAEVNEVLSRVTDKATPATWQDVVLPLHKAEERLFRAWGAVGHLMSVIDSKDWREVYEANLQDVTLLSVNLAQNEKLFAKYKAIRESGAFATLTAEQKRVIDHTLRDFRLSGAELPEEEKAALKAIAQETAELSQHFSQNILDATDAFTLDFENAAPLAGIPQSTLDLYRARAKAAGKNGYRIGLTAPDYLPVMQYAQNRELRHTLHKAYATRASDLGPAERDNGPIIERLLVLRAKEAELLGFKNYAELSLATKMAESPEAVIAFLTDMAKRARPYACRDVKELEDYARDTLGIDPLLSWDRAYASEKLREARYCFSEEQVRSYFPLPKVLSGLFGLAEKLFGIRITPAKASVWHPDVRFFHVTDKDGHVIARFYADLYARAGKRSGAWMDSARDREKLEDGSIRTPVAYLVCNFTPPVDDNPSFLTHREVETIFHEFGHGLQHMLTRVDVADLSGINGVEWDAVEMPSQFMENWTWNYETLASLSEQKDTKEPLSRELFDKMLAAKNFQSGLFCLRQLEFALFDMRIHTEKNPNYAQILHDVRNLVSVTPYEEYDRFAQSFAHIFAGGYAAGYYSYKWAEVLSADAFSAFEETGLFNVETARRWRDEVLATGGSRDAIESFKAFRGRAPKIDALMRHSGLADPI
ncbi:MAG: M3 family metallopeptidase [Sutterella sp.]|nr:M3 family metallopeptidase [Sutterella sp.]